MKRFLISVFVAFLIISFYSCGIGCRAGQYERVPYEFLNKLRLKLPEESKIYCTPQACEFIDSCIQNSVKIEVSEVKDLKCDMKNDTLLLCTFCCLNDSMNSEFTLIKAKKTRNGYIKWLVDDLSLIFKK